MPLESLDPAYPSSIPQNNLRLPDAITIVHGPRRLLTQFILMGDRAARRMGLHLRVRHDFDALLSLNRYEAARGNWYPVIDMFNPERVALNPENAFWISGENENGEIVVTWGARIYDWRGPAWRSRSARCFTARIAASPASSRPKRRPRLPA